MPDSRYLGPPADTHLLALHAGEEVSASLLQFAEAQGAEAARFTAIGALSRATLAFFNPETKSYGEIAVPKQTEVLSLTGNLALFEGAPRLHAHAMLGRPDGSTVGGHFVEGHVQPTLEIFLDVFDAALVRTRDEASGLPLLRF